MPLAKRPARRPHRQQQPSDEVNSVSFVSLGCPKNLVDSEKMLGTLAETGINIVPEDHGADAIVINTCGFLEASKDESVAVINDAIHQKKRGKLKRVIVTGCLVQRHRAKLLEWCPDIDAMIGVFDRDRINEAVRGTALKASDISVDLPVYSSIAANATIAKRERGQQQMQSSALTNASDGNVELKGYFESDRARFRLTPRHYAYLRISEGCNQNCAFCTIPSIRGKMRSKPMDALLSESRELLADGAFELNLIGQDTTSFGEDIEYPQGLSGMLRDLNNTVSQETGAGWLRLMYAYPSCFTDEMIQTIADLPHVLNYIDMPLQHINDIVLDNMRRKTSRKLIETLLNKLRRVMPDIAIRTTFISGFPGETEQQHNELVKFIKDFGFEAVGVFSYSVEPGTPAARLASEYGETPAEVVESRIDEIMLTQQELVFDRHKTMASSQEEIDILIDRKANTQGVKTTGVSEAGTLYTGRSYRQAPDIDGLTFVHSTKALSPGEIVRCKTVDHDGYDLICRPSEEMDDKIVLPILNA